VMMAIRRMTMMMTTAMTATIMMTSMIGMLAAYHCEDDGGRYDESLWC
jgi:hypothetical protein